MYILKIVLNGVGETIMFRFKAEETINYFCGKIQDSMDKMRESIPESVYVEDDFGLSMRIHPYNVVMMQFIDFEKAMEGDAIWNFQQQKILDRVRQSLTSQPIIHRKI